MFAASNDNVGVSTTKPTNPFVSSGVISLKSTEMPDKSNLYTNGVDESVYGEASNQNLYSNYCFKGVTSISYAIHNARSHKLKVVLRRYTSIGQRSVKTISISKECTQYGKFDDLNSSYYYFLDFYSPCDFDGSVKGNE